MKLDHNIEAPIYSGPTYPCLTTEKSLVVDTSLPFYFQDIPPFEVSERTPTARTIRPDAIASHDYIMESQPGPSHLESMGHDDNANLGGSQEVGLNFKNIAIY